MQVHPAALSLHLIDLALAVVLTPGLERQQLRIPGNVRRAVSKSRTVIHPSIASASWAPRLVASGRAACAAVVGCEQLGPVPPSRRNVGGEPIQQDVGLLLDQ